MAVVVRAEAIMVMIATFSNHGDLVSRATCIVSRAAAWSGLWGVGWPGIGETTSGYSPRRQWLVYSPRRLPKQPLARKHQREPQGSPGNCLPPFGG